MKRWMTLAVLMPLAGCASVIDYNIARTADQDCQWMRILADRPICNPYVPPPPVVASAPPLYCYPTLGDIECFADPQGARQTVAAR